MDPSYPHPPIGPAAAVPPTAMFGVCIMTVGALVFTQKDHRSPVHMEGLLTAMEPGVHGMHIHEFGDVRDNCSNAGTHFNPFNKDHGKPDGEDSHLGDLGNVEVGKDGKAMISRDYPGLSLFYPTILSRSLVIHKQKDDEGKGENKESKQSGNSVSCFVERGRHHDHLLAEKLVGEEKLASSLGRVCIVCVVYLSPRRQPKKRSVPKRVVIRVVVINLSDEGGGYYSAVLLLLLSAVASHEEAKVT